MARQAVANTHRKENSVASIKQLFYVFISWSLLVPAAGYSQGPSDHLHLSSGLTQLLQQEMQAIQQGMQALIPAIVSGNWEAVAETGEKIQHSYLMKQQLTGEQRQELQRSLPQGFRELDRSFHHAAGMLAHAARMKNADVINFYFYKLTDTCVACHTRFAVNRFPELSSADSHGEDHH